MTTQHSRLILTLAGLLAAAGQAAPHISAASRAGDSPLTLVSARVTLDGTSNIHAYAASTTAVRLTALSVAEDGDPLDRILQPGGLTALAIAIPVKGLTSPKEGIDKNMHKALKADAHHDITFRLRALEKTGDDTYRVNGSLTIAGVEKDVTLAAKTTRTPATVAVTATVDLLMTDYGIAPPKAMLGMLKTNPAVKVTIDVELGVITPRS